MCVRGARAWIVNLVGLVSLVHLALRDRSESLPGYVPPDAERPGTKSIEFYQMIRSSLKLFGQSGLLQNCIGSAPGFDMIVDDKADIADRTVPDLVIAFSLPFEPASGFSQMLLQASGVICH